MALPGKHGGDGVAPEGLDRGQDTHFVVDQDIVIGRVKTPDIVQFFLLVDVDEGLAAHRLLGEIEILAKGLQLVRDGAAGSGPSFRVESVTANVAPGAAIDGGEETAVTTRSGVSRGRAVVISFRIRFSCSG